MNFIDALKMVEDTIFENKPAGKDLWTKEVWIYDFRTDIHFTLKKDPLKFEDTKDFIGLGVIILKRNQS